MRPKTSQFALLHGFKLPLLATKLGLTPDQDTCYQLKEMFKNYLKVGRTRDLSEAEMRRFIAAIDMLASRELATFLRDSNDPDTADDMTLAEYLQHKQQQDERLRLSKTKEA